MKIDAIFYQDKLEITIEDKKLEYHIGELSCRVAAGRIAEYKEWFPEHNWKLLIDIMKIRLNSLIKCKLIDTEDELLKLCIAGKLDFISGLYGEPFIVRKGIMYDGKKAYMVDKYKNITNMSTLVVLDMVYAMDRNVKFKQCTNCNNVFIAKIEGSMYCNGTAGGEGCRRDAKKIHMEKIKSDPVFVEYEKLYQTIFHQKVRQGDEKKKREIEEILRAMRKLRSDYKSGKASKQALIIEFVRIRNAYCVRKIDEEKYINDVMGGVNENDKIIQE